MNMIVKYKYTSSFPRGTIHSLCNAPSPSVKSSNKKEAIVLKCKNEDVITSNTFTEINF